MMQDADKKKICDALVYLIDPYRIEAMQRYLPEIPKNKMLMEKSCDLADQVEALALGKEQKDTINKLLATMEDLHDTKLSVIYTAGLIDGLVFLKYQGLLDKVFKYM